MDEKIRTKKDNKVKVIKLTKDNNWNRVNSVNLHEDSI
jgi:hypothetical protein